MTWAPPERPAWVRSINADEVLPITAEARQPLERDALLAEARARLGLPDGGVDDFGHPDFPAEEMLEALDRVLAALEGEARLHTLGRWMTRRFLLRLLEVRLQLMAWLRADPGVQDERLEAPLFVAGAPRTGTTLLHGLLALDPGYRAPEGWELLRPVPPPDPDPERFARDARIALADRELVLPQTVVSGLLSIHVYGARRPKECLSAMSFAFRSEEFTARYHVPSYEAWLVKEADMTPAYAMHRLVLQVLQRRRRGPRWVLKSPVHLHSLPTLFAVHPDARVVVTHRDPVVLLASLTSLIANLRWAHSDVVDVPAIARAHVDRYQTSLDALVAASERGSLPSDRIEHLPYAALARDPIGSVEALSAKLGQGLTPEHASRLRAELARRGEEEHGRHVYDAALLGADRRTLDERFRRYREHFGVHPETSAEAAATAD